MLIYFKVHTIGSLGHCKDLPEENSFLNSKGLIILVFVPNRLLSDPCTNYNVDYNWTVPHSREKLHFHSVYPYALSKWLPVSLYFSSTFRLTGLLTTN